MSDQNQDLLARLQAALAAFNANDIETLAEALDADVKYVIHGDAVVSGLYEGLDGFIRAMTLIWELTTGTMSVAPEVTLVGDDAIMSYMRVTGERPDGRRYESHQAYLYRFRDGKLVEGHSIPVDQRAFAAFFND